MTLQEAVKSGKDFRLIGEDDTAWRYIKGNGMLCWRLDNGWCDIYNYEITGEWETKYE